MVLFPCILLEVLSSVLHVYGFTGNTSLWVFERSGRTIHFDEIRGYSLTPVPSRFARITNGVVEYVGTIRGNTQGFPDRDDFSPNRSSASVLRLAILGDSYTAAQYIEQNWPESVENMESGPGKPKNVELLNFSVDGAGLANWWSITTRIISKENYDIDGLVFAVYPVDLHRGFSFAEHRDYSRHMFARASSWNPDDWPRSREDAQELLWPLDGYIVSEDQFSKAIVGDWNPIIPRPIKPYFLMKVLDYLRAIEAKVTHYLREGIFTGDQLKLIREIGAFAQNSSIPVIVIQIPDSPVCLYWVGHFSCIN